MDKLKDHLASILASLALLAVTGLWVRLETAGILTQLNQEKTAELKEDVDNQFDKWDRLGTRLIDGLEEEVDVTREEKNRDIDYWQGRAAYWQDMYFKCRDE